MKARSLTMPQPIENAGMGYYYVNMNIHEVEKPAQMRADEGEGTETVDVIEYEYDQVTTFGYPTYGVVVTALIREQYTESDELAIQRQRESKPAAFAEYNEFCESCKDKARPVFFPEQEIAE